MDSLITAAAHALSTGDPLGALKRVALREDAPALALRGIAMAQLGDLVRAKALVRRAARAFGAREAVSRARCVVAEAEIAFASRDLGWPPNALEAARATLERHGDRVNAAHARYLAIRRLLILGQLDEAEQTIATLDPESLPLSLMATHELIVAGLAMRRVRTKEARDALTRALHAARHARIPALTAEVEDAVRVMNAPAARLIAGAVDRLILLDEVESLLTSDALIVDELRRAVRAGRTMVSLATRPVLFALARALAEASPGDVSRDELVARTFGGTRADESHRGRLRVEVARLRALMRPIAIVTATKGGFALAPRHGRSVAILARPIGEPYPAVLALLADGELWSSSALALAIGASQRSVQRALESLAEAGRVQSIGHGRARRWMTTPVPGFATTLLLAGPLPID